MKALADVWSRQCRSNEKKNRPRPMPSDNPKRLVLGKKRVPLAREVASNSHDSLYRISGSKNANLTCGTGKVGSSVLGKRGAQQKSLKSSVRRGHRWSLEGASIATDTALEGEKQRDIDFAK